MRRREDGTIDYGSDPSVQRELDRGQRLQERQRLPRAQKSRAARQADIDARRNRRNIDIDLDLERQVEDMAAELSVPFSQLITRLAYEGLKTIDTDALRDERMPSRSMRFEYVLPLPGKTKKRARNGAA